MHVVCMQPTYEMVDRRHLQCLEVFEQLATQTFTKYERVRASGSSLLEHTRCELATRFYRKSAADVLLWLDTDMTFNEPGQLVQLCIEAEKARGIVGAAAIVKKPLGHVNTRFRKSQHKAHFFQHGAVIPVESVGTGACAVHRNAFEQVEPRVISCKNEKGEEVLTFYRSLIIHGQWWGEDTSFCFQAREAGVPVLLDTRVRMGHRGYYEYHLEDAGQTIELKDALTMHVSPPPNGGPPRPSPTRAEQGRAQTR